MTSRPGYRARIGVVCAALAALVLVACSSGGGSTGSAATSTSTLSKDPACVALRKLKKTVGNLASPSLLTGGRREIDNAAEKVKSDLTELRDAVNDDLKPSVEALNESVDQLRAAAGRLGSGSLTGNIRAIGNAIQGVGQDAQALVQGLKDKCGSSD